MYAKVRCAACEKEFLLDFGTMSKEDAIQRHDEMKKQGIYCATHRIADVIEESVNQIEVEEQKTSTDEEHVRKLQEEGRDMVDGRCNTVPQFNLPSIHGIPGLLHLDWVSSAATHTHTSAVILLLGRGSMNKSKDKIPTPRRNLRMACGKPALRFISCSPLSTLRRALCQFLLNGKMPSFILLNPGKGKHARQNQLQ